MRYLPWESWSLTCLRNTDEEEEECLQTWVREVLQSAPKILGSVHGQTKA